MVIVINFVIVWWGFDAHLLRCWQWSNKRICFFSEVVTTMINWQQNFASSNSAWNHTHDRQIGLPLRGRPILLSLEWLKTELHSTQSSYHYLSSIENNGSTIFSCNNVIAMSISVSYLSFPIKWVWRTKQSHHQSYGDNMKSHAWITFLYYISTRSITQASTLRAILVSLYNHTGLQLWQSVTHII